MNKERLSSHPQALLTTATHDHKRGEDGRTRLMVLSEPESEWSHTVRKWLRNSQSFLEKTSHGPSPVPADAYFIFQTLISSWPHEKSEMQAYPERLEAYLTKALRESGERTNWSHPDEAYEEACLAFARTCITGEFHIEIATYVNRIENAAALNSLSQTLLRMTSPGVPDLYQGREGWDFSLVDPDNRRPVDYERRERMLAEGQSFEESCHEWKTGRAKQALIETVLNLRLKQPDLFEKGHYKSLEATGPLATHIVAFERESSSGAYLVIAPRLTMALSPNNDLSTLHGDWASTTLPTQADGAVSCIRRHFLITLYSHCLISTGPFLSIFSSESD
ncbi:malto-oligosyltrehalose synthase [Asaia prunellae]|uniref:hypothetical protein n=1 Tax=Asaia prunellae TaxID=610245 RepID=UPI0004722A8A|nr:hypothetical protein [Asaia prunellae]